MLHEIILNRTDISSHVSFLLIGLEDIFYELHSLGLSSKSRILMVFFVILLALFVFGLIIHNYYSINILIFC